jgi:peptide subunit release factor 1 (eRF1)
MVIGRIPQRIQKAKSMGANATVLFATDKNHNDVKENREKLWISPVELVSTPS